MRRRKLLVALAGPAVVVAAVVLWPSRGRITRENCDRIKEGMSRVEVEAILGPPGDYRTGLGETASGFDSPWAVDEDRFNSAPNLKSSYSPPEGWFDNACQGRGKVGVWRSDSFEVIVFTNESEHVEGMDTSSRRMTQGPLANLLWRAKRQWHRWFP